MPYDQNVLSFSYFSGKDDIVRKYDFPSDNTISYLDAIQDAAKWKNESSSIKWSRIWSNYMYSHFLFSNSKYSSKSFHQGFYSGQSQSSSDTIKISDDNKLSDYNIQFNNVILTKSKVVPLLFFSNFSFFPKKQFFGHFVYFPHSSH